MRLLRPIEFYGDFGEDGRLKWGTGDVVVVGEAFTVTSYVDEVELTKATEGTVLEFNAEGAAKIACRKSVSAEAATAAAAKVVVEKVEKCVWGPKVQFYRLFPLPNALDAHPAPGAG